MTERPSMHTRLHHGMYFGKLQRGRLSQSEECAPGGLVRPARGIQQNRRRAPAVCLITSRRKPLFVVDRP